MTSSNIPQSRLQRYSDFVSLHSHGGVYDPESGMEGLLSVVTPDPKGIVLYSMKNEGPVFASWQLYLSTLDWLERNGVNKGAFPVTQRAGWNYCEFTGKNGDIRPGSLANVGAVVKEVYEDTPEGLKVGYCISVAGEELALPIVSNAVEFVNRIRNGGVPHTYDSMLRIFGSPNSATENRRQLATYKIVKFLLDNPTVLRTVDFIDTLGDSVDKNTVSDILHSLGRAGIISYRSIGNEVQGRRKRGCSFYSYTGKPVDADQLTLKKYYYTARKVAPKVVRYIQTHSDSRYVASDLSKKLGIDISSISAIFSALFKIGVLSRETESMTGEKKSVVEANDLTRMLYEMVLEPAWHSASTLQPVYATVPNPVKLKTFLLNYQEERVHIGPKGGEEVRDSLMQALESGEPIKLSYLLEQVNNRLIRNLSRGGIVNRINQLIERGMVEKTDTGYYRKRHS